jgi:subtilisin family serine protease
MARAGVAKSGYIVVLKAGGIQPATAAARARSLGADVTHVYGAALKGFSANMSDAAVAALSSNPSVAWIEPDVIGHAAGQVLPTGVDRVDADLSPRASIDGVDSPAIDVDIAIIDSGIDITHPDLRVVGSKKCVKDEDPTVDLEGHGTFVAGNAAAIDNGSHVVGVAPGARLWAVQALGRNGVGNLSELLCAVNWVTSTRMDADPSNDIEVANMSIVFSGVQDDNNCGITHKDAMHMAICAMVSAGVTGVAAAGNASADAAKYGPAAYDEIITVSALVDFDGQPGGVGVKPPNCIPKPKYAPKLRDDGFAFFSNYGPDIDLIAPGVCVLSTIPTRVTPDGVTTHSGTSMSSPYTAGAAALYISSHPGSTPAQVRAALIAAGSFAWDNSADPDGIKEPLLNVASL